MYVWTKLLFADRAMSHWLRVLLIPLRVTENNTDLVCQIWQIKTQKLRWHCDAHNVLYYGNLPQSCTIVIDVSCSQYFMSLVLFSPCVWFQRTLNWQVAMSIHFQSVYQTIV